MHDTQIVLSPGKPTAPGADWGLPLVIPAYIAAASACLLAIRIILAFLPRITHSAFVRSTDEVERHESGANTAPVDQMEAHVRKYGGYTVFFFKMVRFIAVIALVALSVATVYRDDKLWRNGALNEFPGRAHAQSHFRDLVNKAKVSDEVSLCIVYSYASLLALLSLTVSFKSSIVLESHLNVVLLTIFAVLAYRDLWPLATFTLSPADGEGALLWVKIALLGFASIVIPLTMPRKYIPYDPQELTLEPHPEQTASILSLATYSYYDPIVLLANRIPHLSQDLLPPIADYDCAENLVQQSFKHLDVFSGAPKRHFFWGIVRVFAREYVTLAVLLVIKALTDFFGPLGINGLLSYIESQGNGAIVRPWVWVASLLLGPLVGSLAYQWYTFLTTRVMVRVEAIITQLVFEHSLRVRMKAEIPDSPTPDSRSEASGADTDRALEPENPAGDDVASDGQADADTTQNNDSEGNRKSKQSDTREGGAGRSDAVKTSNLVGKIHNLVSSDLSNITDGKDILQLVLFVPFQIAICIWLLYRFLGWSAFVGLATMIALSPVPGRVVQLTQGLQKRAMEKTDARVQTITESMGVLRMIKLFGWEQKIDERVAEKRLAELDLIKKRRFLSMLNHVLLNSFVPLLIMVATYGTYTGIMKQALKPSVVFPTLAVFDLLRDQFHKLFYIIPSITQAKISLDRVTDFLQCTELLDEFSGSRNDRVLTEGGEGAIGIGKNSSFTWSAAEGSATPSRRRFVLRIEDELVFKQGCTNLIIGPTGSGKTSLLMALLGEMHLNASGPGSWYSLPRKGGVAYAAQEAWIQNETIRDNILFGTPYDETRYEKVIYQCGLKRDLNLFDAGDQTEVGEKGLTLSGGQKARVSLARAVYSPAATILLDDVLAALDVHTARWIVDKCFKGDLLRGRTVLLVTHNIAMASPIADYVVSLGLDGKIASRGTVSDALAKDRTLQAEVAQEAKQIEHDKEELDPEELDVAVKQAEGKLIIAEEVDEGHVSWAAWRLFFASLSGSYGALFWLAFLGSIVFSEVGLSFQMWFIGYWAEQYDVHDDPSEVHFAFYLTIYVLLLVVSISVYTMGYTTYMFGNLRASRNIHRQLVQSLLNTTLRWLDTTPASRVIARCTQDIRALDGPLQQAFSALTDIVLTTVVRLGAIVVLTPVFVIPGILSILLGSWIGQLYMKAQLSVKREMSNAKAPVLGHFGAAIAGLTSVRAYGAQFAFRKESYARINRYTRMGRTYYDLNRWIGLRIDLLAGLITSGLAAYLIYGPGSKTALPSDTGFSLTMAVSFSSMILWLVTMFNQFEVQGNSLERIYAYTQIEQEPKATKEGVPPAYWPSSGDLRVEKLSARYSEDGPKVLHDVSFHVKSGERVGVVGRTGSGKSSLTLSLLRCILTEGEVFYDGLRTSTINLDALRSNITIIPQMPELLSGTLRDNLDPFGQYEDATLNGALRAAGLFSLQTDNEDNRITLDTDISSGGGNLSVGQRQILALGRAIVRGSKLLILDEATSAIDYETDTIIQSSLRHELKGDVTVLTVAHRLQTIMDADKIMVLEAGRMVEFDKPSELLKKPDGRLRSLVDESDDKDALYAMAAGS
ncbi:P-loop containing nucleoside triphosphate hydrolase protein, partial [Artomyces pyxidatus]